MNSEYRQVWRFYSDRPTDSLSVVGQTLSLSADESHFAASVLRLREGESVEVADGRGWICRAKIESVHKKNVAVVVLEQQVVERKKHRNVMLVGLPKAGAVDECVQACVEAGIDLLVFYRADRSSSKQEFKTEKIKKQVMELSRITKSAWNLEVEFTEGLSEALSLARNNSAQEQFRCFVCDERPTLIQEPAVHLVQALRSSKKESDWIGIVGPESSFSSEEYQLLSQWQEQGSLQFVTLGPRILRTPAAVFSAAVLMTSCSESE
ncbi:MAG: hypothetical protein RIR26_1882 [Pseudomonadota bacterium]